MARLLAQGLSQAEIATELGVSRPTVCFHARKLGVPLRAELARRYDWEAIRVYYDEGHSARECREKFGFSRNAWADAIARGVIEARPRSQPLETLMVRGAKRSRHNLKLRLLGAGIKQACCESCGLAEWRGAPIAFQLHHINGNGRDNRLGNLALLCPNCHSQTETWGGRNKRVRNARELSQDQ